MPSYLDKVREIASRDPDGVVQIELTPLKKMPLGVRARETLSIVDFGDHFSVFVLSECPALGIEIDKKPRADTGQLRNVLIAPGNCIQTVAPGEEAAVLTIVYNKIDLAYERCIG